MVSPDIESPWLCAAGESFCGSFKIRVEEGNAADILHVLEVPTSSVPYNCSIPKPPPLPCLLTHQYTGMSWDTGLTQRRSQKNPRCTVSECYTGSDQGDPRDFLSSVSSSSSNMNMHE